MGEWSGKAAKGQLTVVASDHQLYIEGKFPREEIIVRSEEASMLMGRWHWDLPPPHCASCLTTPLVSDKERLRRWGRM